MGKENDELGDQKMGQEFNSKRKDEKTVFEIEPTCVSGSLVFRANEGRGKSCFRRAVTAPTKMLVAMTFLF